MWSLLVELFQCPHQASLRADLSDVFQVIDRQMLLQVGRGKVVAFVEGLVNDRVKFEVEVRRLPDEVDLLICVIRHCILGDLLPLHSRVATAGHRISDHLRTITRENRIVKIARSWVSIPLLLLWQLLLFRVNSIGCKVIQSLHRCALLCRLLSLLSGVILV